jgi:hypothetical protein
MIKGKEKKRKKKKIQKNGRKKRGNIRKNALKERHTKKTMFMAHSWQVLWPLLQLIKRVDGRRQLQHTATVGAGSSKAGRYVVGGRGRPEGL